VALHDWGLDRSPPVGYKESGSCFLSDCEANGLATHVAYGARRAPSRLI